MSSASRASAVGQVSDLLWSPPKAVVQQGGSETRPTGSARVLPVALVVCALFAAGCANVGPKSTPSTPPAAVTDAVEGAYNDDPREPSAFEAAVIAAGKDPAKLAALERELLAALQAPGATPTAMQDAAQHLGSVLLAGGTKADSPALAVLAPMLADESRVDLARLALDPVPGGAIDALYVAAVSRASGRTRLALIQSIGERKIAGAVPALTTLFARADPAVAAAIARALGQIGGATALAALDSAPTPLAPDVLNARLAIAAELDGDVAGRTAEAILRNADAPLAPRSAALRVLIATRPVNAVAEIRAALAGEELMFQQVAIESVATLSTPGAAAELANSLGTFTAPVQSALIAALASRGDAGAVPGLVKVLEDASTDANVRLAAIDALGRLPGNPAVAESLAVLALGSTAEAKAASASLARLNGPGLNELVRTKAVSSNPKLRAVYIQQIAARNLTEAIPFLLSLRDAPESALRLEALDALREIAAPKHQRAVIDWALGAKERSEQTRAVRALITIILREDDVATRARPVLAAIKRGDADASVALLPVLPRIGGAPALATAGELALGADEAVAVAAVTELGRWPDSTALPVLVDVAGKTAVPAVRNGAVRGAAGFLARDEKLSREERSTSARSLLELPVSTAEQNALLNVLSLCSDAEALASAQRYLADPATTAAARDAVDAITSNLAGPPDFKASNSAADAANVADGKTDTSWSVPNAPGEWLLADLKHSRPVRKLTMEQGNWGWAYPAQLEIFVSDDPEQSGELRAQAEGERGRTIVTLPAGTRGRYVWIRQTGTRDAAWAVSELLVE